MPLTRRVEVTFDDERLSQDAGMLLLQRADAKHGLTAALADTLHEWRDPRFVTHTIEELVRSRVFAIAQGYEDCSDFGDLREDPLFKACNGRGANGAALASQPSLSRFEHRAMRVEDLERVQGVLVGHAIRGWQRTGAPTSLVLDLDSTDDPTHGQQQFSLFNGHYGTHCYQQIYIFTAEGDLLWAKLLSGTGNVRASARDGLSKVVAALRAAFPQLAITVRADNGFAGPELYDWCEDNRVDYVVNCGTQRTWCDRTANLMARAEALYAAGSPELSTYVYGEFAHQASTWRSERRIVAKAQRTPVGGDHRFVVTSLNLAAHEVYDFYAGRGQMENWIKDIKLDVRSGRTSTTKFFSNELRVWLHAIAYQLLHEVRRVAPAPLRTARLSTVRLRLLRVAARVRCTARRLWVRLSAFLPSRDDWVVTAQALLA
jgi:hypothetical protein